MLDVGDGQSLHWEECGSPAGIPVVVLHGGPGSGASPGMRQLFDPAAFRIILLDQRGAGRSLPPATEPGTDLSVNTTHHLIRDLETLREFRRVDRWAVFGFSWGSTLGIAYAQAHPDRVTHLVLGPVTMTRPSDVEWLTSGVARFFPAEHEEFLSVVPPGLRGGDLALAYARLLASADTEVRDRAARAWCDWEDALVSSETEGAPSPRFADPEFRYGFARMVTHYFSHAAWLGEDELLAGAHRLAGIPGVLVHGRLDVGGPLLSAWQLSRAWPGSELVVVEGAGHGSHGIGEKLADAADRIAGHPHGARSG